MKYRDILAMRRFLLKNASRIGSENCGVVEGFSRFLLENYRGSINPDDAAPPEVVRMFRPVFDIYVRHSSRIPEETEPEYAIPEALHH